MADHPVRLAPIAPADRTPLQQELLAGVGGDDAIAIFATLVHHPGLFRRWLPFGGKLLQGGKLAGRDRELIILRAALRCGAEYEWSQHVSIAQAAGVSHAEVERVAVDGYDGWSDDDAALLRAVDETLDQHHIGDDTWAALTGRFDTEQLIEIPFVAGHYAMLAGVLGSLGTPREAGTPALGKAD